MIMLSTGFEQRKNDMEVNWNSCIVILWMHGREDLEIETERGYGFQIAAELRCT